MWISLGKVWRWESGDKDGDEGENQEIVMGMGMKVVVLKWRKWELWGG